MKTKIIVSSRENADEKLPTEFENTLQDAILLALKDSGKISFEQYEKCKKILNNR